jgi:hypothetical protein
VTREPDRTDFDDIVASWQAEGGVPQWPADDRWPDGEQDGDRDAADQAPDGGPTGDRPRGDRLDRRHDDIGPAGPAGPSGPADVDGRTGPAGPTDLDGRNGSAGPTGLCGPVGPAGPSGSTHSTGPAGRSGAADPAGPADPWPVADRPPGSDAGHPEARTDRPDLPAGAALDPLADEHFVPPEPPPLPRLGPPILVGLTLIVLGIVLVSFPGWVGVPQVYGLPLGLVSIAAGLGWLVLRLWPDPDDVPPPIYLDDPDDPDGGAVL